MRIIDWISDLCSSDLAAVGLRHSDAVQAERAEFGPQVARKGVGRIDFRGARRELVRREGAGAFAQKDRKSAGWGKSVLGRVRLGGGSTIKKKIRMLKL